MYIKRSVKYLASACMYLTSKSWAPRLTVCDGQSKVSRQLLKSGSICKKSFAKLSDRQKFSNAYSYKFTFLYIGTRIRGTNPRRFSLHTGSNTTTLTRHHCHHFPTSWLHRTPKPIYNCLPSPTLLSYSNPHLNSYKFIKCWKNFQNKIRRCESRHWAFGFLLSNTMTYVSRA
jgi:hypothetical protein